MTPRLPVVIALCTGNAARSVMLTSYLQTRLDGIEVRSRGTHAVEGMPMSWRTKAALDSVSLAAPGHRSTQFRLEDLGAELVVAMEYDHVNWIRREHPELAARTATLPALARWSETWSRDRNAGCSVAMGPRDYLNAKCSTTDAGEMGEVSDPAGGEAQDYVDIVNEVVTLAALAVPFIGDLTGGRLR